MSQTDNPPQDDERTALEGLVRRCRGNMSAIARELSGAGDQRITRQAVTRRLEKHNLIKLVGDLAVASGISGKRRSGTQDKAHKAERKRILDALAAASDYDAAAVPLEVPLRTLYRRIARYQITREQVATRRKQLSRRRSK